MASEAAEIRTRLETVRTDLDEPSALSMSKRLGLGPNTWRLLEEGANLPSSATLLKLAELGFSPGWVLTGTGSMRGDGKTDQVGQTTPLEPVMMARTVEFVIRFCLKEGIEAVPEQIGRIAVQKYQEIWNISRPMIEYIRKTDPAVFPEYIANLAVMVDLTLRREDLIEQPEPSAKKKSA